RHCRERPRDPLRVRERVRPVVALQRPREQVRREEPAQREVCERGAKPPSGFEQTTPCHAVTPASRERTRGAAGAKTCRLRASAIARPTPASVSPQASQPRGSAASYTKITVP